MKYCKRIVIHLLILTALLCFITTLLENMQQTAKIANLLKGEDTKELLRRQQVPAELYDTEYRITAPFIHRSHEIRSLMPPVSAKIAFKHPGIFKRCAHSIFQRASERLCQGFSGGR